MIVVFHLTAVTAAYLLDQLFGDPHKGWHPVIIMGKVLSLLDKHGNRGSEQTKKIKGIVCIYIAALSLTAGAFAMTSLSYALAPTAGVALEAVIIWLMIGGRSMKRSAADIHQELAKGNLEKARLLTSYIVSRDTSAMTEKEMSRSVVESTGENASDSVTAPLFYALLGGAPLAVFYRFFNTADAMIGYKTEKHASFGFGAAKTDDLLNLLPARLTAVLMGFSSLWLQRQTLLKTWKDTVEHARLHESPNAGFGESAMSAVLFTKLGGPAVYHGRVKERPYLGIGTLPLNKERIKESIFVWDITILLFLTAAWIGGGIYLGLA
ncbi:adenosylcobinamide-phosphate synthase CbiB [Sinobaca sp. H24]|uniref:adenosylcobinamide-phosphate synthase CbiB n=1 Tax=Sinobaca sp. H24 TaxID=2923376 RepID=UPI00207A8209|nr:adenosylcobinamide-phosphate synthase CbiB [Sinobaca sp. H24]